MSKITDVTAPLLYIVGYCGRSWWSTERAGRLDSHL